MADRLFHDEDLPPRTTHPAELIGQPRFRRPQRDQIEFRSAALDQLLPPEHEARLVWEAVIQLDVSPWLLQIKAVEHHVGRDATHPHLLLALWIYATLQGEGSAREIARLCQSHIAYQWLCGGVSMNHHTLSDFRSQAGDKWDALLTQLVASLMSEGLVTLRRVAQDGMRVRANAGKSSFRRAGTLSECLKEAREQVETLRRLAEEDPSELTRRQSAARQRAAEERTQRVQAAIKHCEELQKQREKRAKTTGEEAQPARASTTDPEARNMKFANGGYNPGHNVQFATDTQSGIIVGVEVTNAGSDSEQLSPMLDQLHTRYGENPEEALVDGGFATKEGVTDADENHACRVYAPLKEVEKQLSKGVDPHAAKKGDSKGVAAWRARMGTGEAKQIYKLRAQTAEWVNATCRNRGLWQMPVRGLTKCRAVAVLYALTHNLLHAMRLRAQALQTSLKQ
jgi:transposase